MDPRLAIIATIQQAISTLLTTYEPEFLRIGYSMFISFATILIVWEGIKMMLSQDSLGDHMFGFARLLLFIAFGYDLVAFYAAGDVGLVTPFRDGMNLVAKEYVWCQKAERGSLVLSKFTGAARELTAVRRGAWLAPRRAQ